MPPKKNDQCKSCGGYDFSLTDGFMYCNRCGSLLENFEELEEEEVGLQRAVGAGKIRIKRDDNDRDRRKNNALPKKPSKMELLNEALEKRNEFLKRQAARRENLPYNQTPDYLYGVGRRLFCFTQILSKSAYILVKELRFEPTVQKMALAVFQRYLAHCQVAFCADEQCGNDESLRFVAVMENLNYQREEREEKRRKKLESRGKGVKALSKSAAAWTLLTQGNITENLDMESDDEEENREREEEEEEEKESDDEDETRDIDDTVEVNDITMGFVRKITTSLSKEALRRAEQVVLSLEILATILHTALMCSGYQNVFLSDVIRWIREDRFRITKKAIRYLNRAPHEKLSIEDRMLANTGIDTSERELKFPLYEVVRTATIFHQSLDLTKSMAPSCFEKLAARMTDNLNLPVDMLSRVLLLEHIVPCDVSPMLLKQADVRMGKDFRELTGLAPKLDYTGYMSSFGWKRAKDGRLVGQNDEVLLSADTKVMAYLLLSLKLTFDLDHAPCTNSDSLENQFDIDTWIHQLEMRIQCWQGHDMSMVLRSTCPIPDLLMEKPFGSNAIIFDERGRPFVSRRRRQVGFRKCIPSEMSFNSTAELPTVFDVRENRYKQERSRPEALMEPLKFQRVVLRREMDSEPAKFEHIDRESEATFFKDFTNLKTTDVAEDFQDIFPCSSCYTQYARPDWMTDCSITRTPTTLKTGPLRFYLGTQSTENLLAVASPTFSPRFRFLLRSLALIIGEEEKALYAAFVMLEMHVTCPEKLENTRQSLTNSEPILVQTQRFSNTSFHHQVKYGIVPSDRIERVSDLRWFDLRTTNSNRDILETANNETERKEQQRPVKYCYEFEKFFAILAVKIW